MANKSNELSVANDRRLEAEQLRKTIDYTSFEFQTTEELPTLTSIVGQERGRSVMKFGLNVNKVGYNLYVAGIAGTGKRTFTRSIVEEFARKDVSLYDWCYVYNFEDGYRPKILKLPARMGRRLEDDMEELIDELKDDIPRAFNDEQFQKERSAIIRDFNSKTSHVFKELNDIAETYGFVIRQSGSGILTIPVIDGKPISEEEFRALDEERVQEIDKKTQELQETVLEHTHLLRKLENETTHVLKQLEEKVALAAAGYHIDELKFKYEHCSGVLKYLDEVLKDILKNLDNFLEDEKEEKANPIKQMLPQKKDANFEQRYMINLLVDNSDTEGAPVIVADNPTYYNLIGKVEYESRMGVMSTNFTKIKPGFLHYANGGYIIIQAKDIFSNNYAWQGLKRSLLNEELKIENIGEQSGLVATSSINPEPIPLDVKVIIIGDLNMYQLLYHYDEDFSKLFKIKADFDVEMDSNLENMTRLASFIHTHCKEHDLLSFDRTAVGRIVEYSTRLAGHQNKLSTRFNQQVEIIYEADTWAKMMGDPIVSEKHIVKAIEERDYRNNLYEEKVQETIEDGTVLIDTDGKVVGQVNGLAVYNLGQYSFGKPTRITATTFAGQDGIINIERESKMSGNIHNKGIYILGGYLGKTFAQTHPLSLTAHIAFEQSYGGVDGDSASSTELYALLSSLADLPIKQGLAVTGSVNQHGKIQPIGGVNEKIEGFFEVCDRRGLTGDQGVLIPYQNVQNLMLKEEVIDAVREGNFHVYAIESVEEGIEILTGHKVGSLNDNKKYDEGSLYRKVADKLKSYIDASKEAKD